MSRSIQLPGIARSTYLDRAVAVYLYLLAKERPNPRDEHAVCARMDALDRARWRVLHLMLKRPRYRRLRGRAAWMNRKTNPHRPPML